MLINRRNGLMAGGGLSAKSYVQDGLVAMWDGIENAGWGVHDANATTWKDLTGNLDLSLKSGAAWSNNGLYQLTNRYGLAYSASVPSGEIKTMEACMDMSSDSSNNNGRALLCINNNRAIMSLHLTIFRSRGAANCAGINQNVIGKWTLSIVYSSAASDDALYWCGRGRNRDILVDGNWNLSTRTTIGCNNLYKALATNTSIIGGAYCVRLYSRALTADEIAANYAVDKARFNLPDAT